MTFVRVFALNVAKLIQAKKALQDHIRDSHQNKVFTCSECFRTFPKKTYLTKHVRKIHLGERLYPCELCDKRFKDKFTLGKHTTSVHDKVKPFLCELCNFECSRLDNLNLHRKKSHGVPVKLSKSRIIEMVEHGDHLYYDKE